MKRILYIATLIACGLLLGVANAQTKATASITQTVTAAAPILPTITLVSSNPSAAVGTKVTYSGTVLGTNNGKSPTGTVTVVATTGAQTVTLSATGAYTCSETLATPGTYTVTATYNGDSNFLASIGVLSPKSSKDFVSLSYPVMIFDLVK